MPSADVSDEPIGDPWPGDLAEAGIYRSAAEGFEHGLVVLAAGEPYWLLPSPGGFRLLVEPREFERISRQLSLYDRESVGWPPLPVVRGRTRRAEFATPLLWAMALMVVFWCQEAWPGRLEETGALDTQALFVRGQWWRPATALFLHADVGHLTANLLSGIFAFSAVVSTFGRRRGWVLLALASVAGNIGAAALNYPGPYRSLGASTAVFAGLGLLTGRAIGLERSDPRGGRWKAVLAPLAAGLALLGLFGTGGFEVDIGAHAAGFGAGFMLGIFPGDPSGGSRGPSPRASEGRPESPP
jgi:membrane associated rhomboid family serine protease